MNGREVKSPLQPKLSLRAQRGNPPKDTAVVLNGWMALHDR